MAFSMRVNISRGEFFLREFFVERSFLLGNYLDRNLPWEGRIFEGISLAPIVNQPFFSRAFGQFYRGGVSDE